MYWGFCGTGIPEGRLDLYYAHSGEEWLKTNYLGLVTAVGFDVSLGKFIYAGMDFSTAFYHSKAVHLYDQSLQMANLRLNVGTRF